eukprot:346168-Hanusia_phi.AAC.2
MSATLSWTGRVYMPASRACTFGGSAASIRQGAQCTVLYRCCAQLVNNHDAASLLTDDIIMSTIVPPDVPQHPVKVPRTRAKALKHAVMVEEWRA